MESFTITKIKGSTCEVVDDFVVKEIPLTISVNDKELATLLCSPEDLKDLVVGFLFTSGLIQKADDIKKIVLDEQQWIAAVALSNDVQWEDMVFKRLYTPGCGKGTLFYNVVDLLHKAKNTSSYTLAMSRVSELTRDFRDRSQVYLKTGGVHSAAIADDKGIIVFRDDIGRHNALDKVIGYLVNKKDSFENKVIITSGRISSEVLLKTKKCGIPIIISRSAPTNQAVRHAREMGITLVGFARSNRMNIYSGEKRIVA